MKKKIIGIWIVLAMLLAGCGTHALPDTYLEASDYQYTEWYQGMFFPKVQRVGNMVYIFHNGFIYYLEEGTDVILPLCNKADCLHDKETDQEKLKDCNAFMGTYEDTGSVWWQNAGIASCNGYIYFLNSAVALRYPQTLRRCALDGTEKENVYTWDNEESAILEWIIHRDVIYYVEKRYFLEEDEVVSEMSLKALSLTGLNKQPVTLYTQDEDLQVLSLGNLQAYGNHIYAEIVANRNSEGDSSSEEDYDDRVYVKTFVYDIVNDSLDELTVPGLSQSATILGVQFWQDKIILCPYDSMQAGDAPMPVYIAELDGSNPEVLFEDISQSAYFLTDGEYLYLFDNWMPDLGDRLSNPGVYTVYDESLNIVDTFTAPLIPGDRTIRLPVGGMNWMYYKFDDEENDTWGVMGWDKSGIGSYDGAEIEIAYIYR